MSRPERPTDPSAQDASASRLPLTDNPLFLAGQQDFIDALAITDMMPNYYLLEAQTKIALEQVRAGLQPSFTPTFLLNEMTGKPNVQKTAYGVKVAEIQARMGDLEGSSKTMPLASSVIDIDARIGIIRGYASHGVDVRTFFEDLYTQSSLLPRNVPTSIETISDAEQELTGSTSARKRVDAFMDTVPEQSRPRYLPELAVAYARLGYPDEALAAWEGARHESNWKRAEDFSYIVLSRAATGKDPSELIVRAGELAEAIENVGDFSYEYLRVEIYGRLAQAQALAGGNPQQLIDRALEHTNRSPKTFDHIVASSLMEVARAQKIAGLDAQPTFEKALQLAESSVEPSEPLRPEDVVSLGMAWEDIFNAQVELGCFDEARKVVDKLDQLTPQNPDFLIDKATWLAILGSARIKAVRVNS